MDSFEKSVGMPFMFIQNTFHTERTSVEDPDPDVFWTSRIRILPSISKKSEQNLDFYYFVTSFWLFMVIYENWCKCTSGWSVRQWYGSADPDPYQDVTERIKKTKWKVGRMLWYLERWGGGHNKTTSKKGAILFQYYSLYVKKNECMKRWKTNTK